jgi:putative FmdB family regulatory protein
MPTYEYLCKTCNNRFEKWQKMTDEPLTTCPECGGLIRRVFYPAGIVFKGSGFYKTDHGTSTVADPSNHATKSENGAAPAANETKTANDSASSSGSTSSSPGTTANDKVAAPTK